MKLLTYLLTLAALLCVDDALASSDSNSSKPFFIKQGNKYTVTSREALDLHERLPTQTYTVGMTPMGEYYLQVIDPFDIQGKIYGNVHEQADRILKTFSSRSGSTGVLLAGEKGSGKTFLTKYISIQAAQQLDVPTIVINQPLAGERFNAFLQSIQQPTVFLFDEFEKVYSDKIPHGKSRRDQIEYNPNYVEGSTINQDSLLTLLDGTYSSKTLFLLTSNDKYKVSSHMRNRPGRIFYVLDFAGLSTEFITQYCDDKLLDTAMIPQVVAVSTMFEAFNFDMLQAVVEEMNRYNETPFEALKLLNVRTEFEYGSSYDMQLFVDGKAITKRRMGDTRYGQQGTSNWFGQPLLQTVSVQFSLPRPKRQQMRTNCYEDGMTEEDRYECLNFQEEEEEYGSQRGREQKQLVFTPNEIDGMDPTSGTFWYWKEEDKARLVLQTKSASSKFGGLVDFERIALLDGPPKDLLSSSD